MRLLRLQHLHRDRARRTWPGASRSTYADAAVAEVRFARRVLGDVDVPVGTVFFGGGTPTLLPPADLARVVARDRRRVRARRRRRGDHRVEPGQRRPRPTLAALREGGVNRVSFGMQSAVPHVLRVLDRTHDPERVPQVVQWARDAGFEQVSLDLIYGTPGESLDGLGGLARRRAGVRAGPRVGVRADRRGRHRAGPAGPPRRGADDRRRRPRGQVPPRRRGARPGRAAAGTRCRTGRVAPTRGAGTTSLYWPGGDWWGVGPGAHAHVGGVRWWNVKHPTRVRRRGSATASARPTAARCSTRRPGVSSGCCSRRGSPTGCRSRCSTTPAAAALPDQVERGLVEPRRSTGAGWCSPRGAGCSPTRVVRDLRQLTSRKISG